MKQVDTIILVKDIIKSKEFYEKFFKLEILHDWESMIVFKNRLALHQKDLIQPKSFADKIKLNSDDFGNIIIYIELEKGDSLEELLAKAENEGIEVIHGIYSLPWQRIIRILDPDNNIIEIGEPN